MNDLCFGLIILVCVALVIAVIGHGIWLVLAAFFRLLGSASASPNRRQPAEEECPRCQRLLAAWVPRCESCGLERDSGLARELSDLNAMARQLDRFEANGSLGRSVREQLETLEMDRRRQLAGLAPLPKEAKPKPAPDPVFPIPAVPLPVLPPADLPLFSSRAFEVSPPVPPVEEATPFDRLRKLLAGSRDGRDLTPNERTEALRCFQSATESDLASLRPGPQLGLARLLETAGMTKEALAAFRRRVQDAELSPETAAIALEAGRLAKQLKRWEEAAWFLERALAGEGRPEAEALLREVQLLLDAEVVDALPADLPAPVPASVPLMGTGWRVVSEERAETPVASAAPSLPERPLVPSLERPTPPMPAPTPRPVRVPEPEPPPPPRRSLGEVLAAFMEEKNILWGELIGGLLIIGCSVALVISLWQTLEQIQYFPFLVIASMTAALFGSGLYTLHHWKLESTSRGLLVIATMLVPLDFLVLAGLRGDYDVSYLIDPLVIVTSLALFSYLVNHAGRVLFPGQHWLLPLAVLGPAAGQLVAQLLMPKVPPAPMPLLFLLGLLPVACQAGSVGVLLRRRPREEPLTEIKVRKLLGFLAIATFTLALAFGFLVFLNGDIPGALQKLSPLVVLAAIAPLACGLVVHQRLAGDLEQGASRTAGTVVALVAMAVMLLAVVLAWPAPLTVLVVCLINFLILTVVAFHYELPVAHAVSLPCATLGYLAAVFGMVAPEGESLGLWLFSSSSGTALVFLVGVLAVTGETLWQRQQRAHAGFYAAGAGIIGIFSLMLVTRDGTTTPGLAALVYGLYGVGSILMNVRWRRESVSYVGLGLIVAATLWGLLWRVPENLALWGAVVAAEALVLALLRTRLSMLPDYLARPMARTAECAGALAVVLALSFGLARAESFWSISHAVTGVFLTGLFGVLAVGEGRPFRARLSGAMVIATVAATAGWATSEATPVHASAVIILAIAMTGLVLAKLSVVTMRRTATMPWLDIMAPAWRDSAAVACGLALLLMVVSPGFPGPALNAWSLASIALTALVLAWAFQGAPLTWVGSGLLLASLCHAFVWNVSERSLSRSLMLALLTQATAVLIGSLLLQARRVRDYLGEAAPWERLHPIIAEPLRQSALLASVLAVPLVALPTQGQMLPFAGLVGWLAAFWLAVSWLEHWPRVFTAFQAALSVAVVYAVTAWLEPQEWVSHAYPEGLADPRSLQAYGLGLGALGLLWAGMRLRVPSQGTLREMLEFVRPAFDEVVLALLVVGQLAVACWGLVPGIDQELVPAAWGPRLVDDVAHAAAFGGGAWALLGLLSVLMILALWQRWPKAALLGALLLTVTVPVLTAGPFAADLATASALRWGLALCFLGTAVPLWLRDPLARRATKLRLRFEDGGPSVAARSLLIVCCVVPVLLLTGEFAVVSFSGQTPPGPVGDSFFGKLGFVYSNALPLIFIAGTLVGHALRERQANYAFAAGLLLDVTLMSGYALGVILSGRIMGDEQVVLMLQLGSLGAAAWSLLWLASQRYVVAWADGPGVTGNSVLMNVQVSLGVAGNVLLLLMALGSLALTFPLIPRGVTEPVYPAVAKWAGEVGSLLGWLVLGLTAAGVGYRAHQRGWSWSGAVGGLGLMAVAFLACNAARWANGEDAAAAGYRTLMLGWGGYALGYALVALRQVFVRREMKEDGPTPPAEMPTFWVSVAATLAVLLGLKAAFYHHDQLWAAGAIGIASVAGAAVAVGRRREGWAFLAGLGLDVAAMCLVWHFHRDQVLSDWIAYLIQATSAAAGAGALLWLATRKRFYGSMELRLSSSPLLALQILMGVIGNAVLLGLAALALFVDPASPRVNELHRLGQYGGWLALLMPMAASLWYAARSSLPRRFFLIAGHFLLIGILAACSISKFDTGDWLAFHVLLGSWVTAGLLVLALGLLAVVFEAVPFPLEPGEERNFLRLLRNFLRDSIPQIQGWAEFIGLCVVFLALRGVTDRHPWAPYWSVSSLIAVSLMTVGMALWSRRTRHVYESGVLVNLAGLMLWLHDGPYSIAGFVSVNALCLGISSTFWSVLHLTLDTRLRWAGWRGGALPFRRFAAALGLGLLALLVGVGVISDLTQGQLEMAGALTWAALIAVAIAVFVTLWDATATLSGAGLYVVGLTAIGLLFNGENLDPTQFGWAAAVTLAGYVWLTRGIVWSLGRWPGLAASLGLPPTRGAEPAWFSPAQSLVASIVVTLSVWIALTFASPQSYLGPLAVGLLIPAGILAAGRLEGELARFSRMTTLLGGVVIAAEIGWAAIGPSADVLWLHRSISLLVSFALLTGVYAPLPRWLPSPWSGSARNLGPTLLIAAVITLAGVLTQEALATDLPLRIEPWAVSAVALSLVWLILAGLVFAVMPGQDPFNLSERGRTIYVYAGEVFLVLIVTHLKLCRPLWFTGRLAPYYSLIIMTLAFGGVGLAELFKRRGVRVISEPLERTGLFLPLLPIIAFWFRPVPGGGGLPLATGTGFDRYAWLWFMVAGFYATMGMMRRSFRYALIAALAANFGLWSYWHHSGLAFVAHPQLWMVPMAVILLVSEHLNRDRLAAQQAQGLRYLALGLIYVSSTADMFLGGLGQQWWPPLVLMFLAVGGMLLGIVLRVRAYLFLGFSFLFLDIVSMIWHAGNAHIWVWWVSGIVLGILILALFAVFEKRRDDMLRLIEQIKDWD